MKFKSFVKLLVGTVVVGVATVVVLNTLQKNNELTEEDEVKADNENIVKALLKTENNTENSVVGEAYKARAGIAIAQRHENATEVIAEALTNIKSTEKQHNDREFAELTNDLKSLLK